jgi:hypothetical protein
MGIPQKNIAQPEITPIRIDSFLGINKSADGTTEMKTGEARECINFRVTEGYNLKKMEGYKAVFESLGEGDIHSLCEVKLKGIQMIVFNYEDKLYKRVNQENIEIGMVANNKLSFFYFNDKLYILDGQKYRSYDGEELKEVEGYVPKVAINAPPSGGGTNYEQINLLNGKKHMTFSPDGTATKFVLPEKDLTSIDRVYVKNELLTVTKNLEAGTVIFETAPAEGVGTVDIYWTKENTENRALIEKCTQAFIFGGSSDTRVFLYGNPDKKNREYFSGVTTGPSAEYFPANNYKDIDTDEYAITSMERQYDRQIIFKENKTWYGTIESSYDALDMLNTDFPAYPLNSDIGNVAPGQTRVLLNNPVSINKDGIYELVASQVRDERNMQKISKRVDMDFEDVDLSQVITVDWQEKKEFWVHIPQKKMCWIYNYGNDTWYKRSNIIANSFLVSNGELYFASKGTIYKFDKAERVDNGKKTIHAICELGFQGFEAEWKKKKIKKVWVMLKPESKAYVRLSYETDRDAKTLIGEAEYNTCDFWHFNFGKFSFLVNLSVKPFRLKTRAKKFAYFSLIIENDRAYENATVTCVDLKCTTGGEIK